MDERATHTPTGTVDAHPAVSVEMRNRAQRRSIDGAGQHDTTDLTKVLQAIAARIDVVLDEKVAAGAEPEGRHRAARAWSSVVGKRTAEDTSELRRHALATTVLRISADGRLDIDDREPDERERDEREQDEREHADGKHDDGKHEDRTRDVGEVVAKARTETETEPESHDAVSASSVPTPTDRSDVEARLRAARERLESRRASTAAGQAQASGSRARRARRPALRRNEVRTVVQRVLIGLAIVGASAVVSILVT